MIKHTIKINSNNIERTRTKSSSHN